VVAANSPGVDCSTRGGHQQQARAGPEGRRQVPRPGGEVTRPTARPSAQGTYATSRSDRRAPVVRQWASGSAGFQRTRPDRRLRRSPCKQAGFGSTAPIIAAGLTQFESLTSALYRCLQPYLDPRGDKRRSDPPVAPAFGTTPLPGGVRDFAGPLGSGAGSPRVAARPTIWPSCAHTCPHSGMDRPGAVQVLQRLALTIASCSPWMARLLSRSPLT
jgi:hypothetical protein